ncbi:MAG: amidohydrolase/deacetylase family metallohydrolase [Candidatus Limnocylindria bacterium]
MNADLLLTGGTVIDPASGLHDRRDVAIAGGRIVAIEPAIASVGASEVVDATDAFVVPGLIDLHVHVYPGVADLSVEPDPTCLGRGVTTVVDAGSSGANTFAGFRRYVIEPSRGRILAYLNISLLGQVDTMLGELHDLRFADPERAARVALADPDLIVGFKVRLSEMLAGSNGLEGLRLAIEAGEAAKLPVMAHIGGTRFDIEEALALFRPGDVVTHTFTGWQPGALVDDAGRVVAAAREARARGVHFDVGHGQGSFTWSVAEAAMADGFRPDTISTDLHRFDIASPVGDLPTTMSKFLLLGCSLDEVVTMTTTAAAGALGPLGRTLGRLTVGGVADVTVLRLEEGRVSLMDARGDVREGRQRLVPLAVVRDGRRVAIEPLVSEPPDGASPPPGAGR